MITITSERLRELVKAAYEDGLDDGIGRGIGNETVGDVAARLWPESVTADNLGQDLKKAQLNGGKFK